MRVIYLGLAVPPLDEYHNMFTELMIEFKNDGHEVLIVGPALDDGHTGLRKEDNFDVLRVPTMKLFNVGKYQKGIANILLPFQYKKMLKKSNIDLNFDLVVIPTPPITLGRLAAWLKSKYKSKVYLVLRDIFPQNAVDLNLMSKTGLAHRYFRHMEKKLYNYSDHIGCMSQGNIDFIIEHNPSVKKDKLHLLPNWGPLREVSNTKDVAICEKYGFTNKFVVIFGGNLGVPQKVENIIALAKSCKDIDDIFFIIFGNGTERDKLTDGIAENDLKNIRVEGYLSRIGFFQVLQQADVGLISLSQDFTIPNIPSKTLVYLNAKKPILASIDKNTDYGDILDELNAGLWVQAGNHDDLKQALLRLYNDPELRRTMGENGYEYMKNNLLSHQVYETVKSEIKHT